MKISIILALMFCGGFLAFIFQGLQGILSYEVGFVSFLCVFISLYISTQNKIKTLQGQAQIPQEEEEKIKFSQKFSLGMGMSFSFFRIISYIGLIGALILLIEWNFFGVYAYMIGIFLGLLGSLLFVLLPNK